MTDENEELEERKQYAIDIIQKAKQLELLIASLPASTGQAAAATAVDSTFEVEYAALETELAGLNADFRSTLARAGQLLSFCVFIYVADTVRVERLEAELKRVLDDRIQRQAAILAPS